MEAGLKAGENPLFYLPPCYGRYEAGCRAAGLPVKGANVSLGDVDARSLARESGHRRLAAELGLDPDSENFRQIQLYGEELYRHHWFNDERGITGYQATAGLEVVRAAAAEFYNFWTGLTMKPEQTFVSTGGGSGVIRVVFKSLAHQRRDEQRKPVLLTATPYYGPAIDMAGEEGYQVPPIDCGEDSNYFFDPDQAAGAVKEHGVTDMYVATVGNPTGRMIPAEQLNAVMAAVFKANPNIRVVLDTVYNCNLGKEKSVEQLAGFHDSEWLAKTVFIHSLSKSHFVPAHRLGFWLTADAELAKRVLSVTGIGNPSPAIAVQQKLYGILSVVTKEAIDKGSEVYRSRLEAGRELLDMINQAVNLQVFKPLNSLPDAGLYLYPQLGESLPTAFKIFEQLGLFMAPGLSFGESSDSNRARIALGRHAVPDIQAMASQLDLG